MSVYASAYWILVVSHSQKHSQMAFQTLKIFENAYKMLIKNKRSAYRLKFRLKRPLKLLTDYVLGVRDP